MEVVLTSITKRYGYQAIIQDVNLTIKQNSCVGITGANGSGKSTLMKIISGYLSPSNGTIQYAIDNHSIPKGQLYTHLTYAAPYIGVADLFTLRETLYHNMVFKPFYQPMTYEYFLDRISLPDTKEKYLRDFSSGMRQKVLLALAILSKSELLLLDEPTAYLDKEAKKWFFNLLSEHAQDRTVVIASNEQEDFNIVKGKCGG